MSLLIFFNVSWLKAKKQSCNTYLAEYQCASCVSLCLQPSAMCVQFHSWLTLKDVVLENNDIFILFICIPTNVYNLFKRENHKSAFSKRCSGFHLIWRYHGGVRVKKNLLLAPNTFLLSLKQFFTCSSFYKKYYI